MTQHAWLYIRTAEGYEVGYYDVAGRWHKYSVQLHREAAADQCARLKREQHDEDPHPDAIARQELNDWEASR